MAQGINKNKIASNDLNNKVLSLIKIAARNSKMNLYKKKSSSRLFEVALLADLLEEYKKNTGGSVDVVNKKNNILYLPSGTAYANRKLFSYFELKDRDGQVVHEVWSSVQVSTVSYDMYLSKCEMKNVTTPNSAVHEIDIGIFEKNIVKKPSYEDLHAGFSCKHLKPAKESIREALGFRRETGFVCPKQKSLVQWLQQDVPVNPASPFYLVSSSTHIRQYNKIDHLSLVGLYLKFVKFPI